MNIFENNLLNQNSVWFFKMTASSSSSSSSSSSTPSSPTSKATRSQNRILAGDQKIAKIAHFIKENTGLTGASTGGRTSEGSAEALGIIEIPDGGDAVDGWLFGCVEGRASIGQAERAD